MYNKDTSKRSNKLKLASLAFVFMAVVGFLFCSYTQYGNEEVGAMQLRRSGSGGSRSSSTSSISSNKMTAIQNLKMLGRFYNDQEALLRLLIIQSKGDAEGTTQFASMMKEEEDPADTTLLEQANGRLYDNVKSADMLSEKIVHLGKIQLTVENAQEFSIKLYSKFEKSDGVQVINDLKTYLFDYAALMKEAELLSQSTMDNLRRQFLRLDTRDKWIEEGKYNARRAEKVWKPINKYTISSLERSAEEMSTIHTSLETLQKTAKGLFADVNAKLAELGVKPKAPKTPTAPHANGVKVPANPDDKAKDDKQAEEYLLNLDSAFASDPKDNREKYAYYYGNDPYAEDPYAEDPYADTDPQDDEEEVPEQPDTDSSTEEPEEESSFDQEADDAFAKTYQADLENLVKQCKKTVKAVQKRTKALNDLLVFDGKSD